MKELESELNARFETQSCAYWLDVLEEAGIPAGPILDVIQMHNDPQTAARQMVPTVTHPVAGEVQTIGLPIKFESTPGRVAAPAPIFGQHTAEVLRELGYSDDDIAEMGRDGAAHLADLPGKEAAE